MSLPVVIAFWCVPIVAMVMICLGRRGKRIDDHPWCRRCRFDLFGSPADRANCPECGADLMRRRAVRVGQRRKRMGLLITGLLLAVLSSGGAGTVTWHWARHFDFNTIKPVWWLLYEAEHGGQATVNGAFQELGRRHATGVLDAEDVQTLINKAIAIQGDRNQPWESQWGMWVQWLHLNNVVSDAQWRQYLDQAFSLQFAARQRVGRRDPWTVIITESAPPRIGKMGYFVRHVEEYMVEVREAVDKSVRVQIMDEPFQVPQLIGVPEYHYPEINHALRLPPGRYVLTAKVAVRWYESNANSPATADVYGRPKPLEAPVEVLDMPTSVILHNELASRLILDQHLTAVAARSHTINDNGQARDTIMVTLELPSLPRHAGVQGDDEQRQGQLGRRNIDPPNRHIGHARRHRPRPAESAQARSYRHHPHT